MTHKLVDEALRNRGVLTDVEIEKLAASGMIDPFDPMMLSGCSYDLRVGRVLRSRNRMKEFDLERGEYTIESGECVTLETLETVDFRSTLLFGLITNKHSVLARGLVHPITKIDPGFRGPLAITIFNMGHVSEPISLKQPLVSLVFMPVGSMPQRIYGVSQKGSQPEGSVKIASLFNARDEPLTDGDLAKMYGRPVARLYERVAELEKYVEAGLITQDKEKKARAKDIRWRYWVGIFTAALGAALALVGRWVLDNWSSWFNQ